MVITSNRDLGLASFSALSTLILIIATGSNNWASYESGGYGAHFGLFVFCVTNMFGGGCGSFSALSSSADTGWLGACQFFAVIAILMAIFVTFVMFLQAAGVRIPVPLTSAKFVQLNTGLLIAITLCTLMCFAIFAGKYADFLATMDLNWGFALMIISFLFFAGITMAYHTFAKNPASGGGAAPAAAAPKPAEAQAESTPDTAA